MREHKKQSEVADKRIMKARSRKRRNGSVIAHGREWPLYERWERGVMVLFMSLEDQAEKYALDEQAVKAA